MIILRGYNPSSLRDWFIITYVQGYEATQRIITFNFSESWSDKFYLQWLIKGSKVFYEYYTNHFNIDRRHHNVNFKIRLINTYNTKAHV